MRPPYCGHGWWSGIDTVAWFEPWKCSAPHTPFSRVGKIYYSASIQSLEISLMEARQLRHFLTVAETLHFGRAAERLNMTQPPLSQSILALERQLEAALFIRSRRSVALSPFGQQWLPHVRAALASLEALPGIARRLRDGETGRLELSFVSTADYSILPSLVRRYAALYPDVEIVLTEATSDVQIDALLHGRGHAGIVIHPDRSTLPAALAYHPLTREKLIAAVPDNSHDLSPHAIMQSPLIIFPRHSAPAFYDLVTHYHARYGGGAAIAQEAIQMQTIISLVSAGMGIALVPASLRHLARTGVRYVDLEEDAPILETGMIWRRDDTAPILSRLLEVAQDMSEQITSDNQA
ncbi:Transcriptional regulator, LysR family [Granulibacter bethesdensis CGDNIH1]|uniref:Transcriptional regulator, LysR family n=2 Tax=Granulibacter bethesdensis TaxID=364410 RepID=Q0BQR5_GRABC|nr:Transcriptional regulator, LysR family [Granulibacter bethesdensis CGDNIH1]APH52702.1 Transcriptional regulator, LysR family [Granulibacter bethesdensis]APH65391.1 Transcriptional regulator, LysR family [Granulibacter bethesdensis]